MNTKIAQRENCLLKRKKIKKISKKIADFIIFKKTRKFLLQKNVKEIGIYWSKKYEVNTHKIIDYCLKHNIKVFLPKIIDKKEMIFLEYKYKNNLIFNKLSNVYEPKKVNKAKTNLKFMIIPMVGYDNKLNRIGYGAGYYDRFLTKKDIFKIGIAYKSQKVNNVITKKHDIKIDMIISN